jgi:hypothetical protein
MSTTPQQRKAGARVDLVSVFVVPLLEHKRHPGSVALIANLHCPLRFKTAAAPAGFSAKDYAIEPRKTVYPSFRPWVKSFAVDTAFPAFPM